MKATLDHVIIVPDEAQTKTKSGILLQEAWKDLPPSGVILSVGPDVKQKELKEGVRVVFYRYSAVRVTDMDELDEVRIVREHHIIAILEDEDATS
jgi:chaperonin GroES